MSFGELALNNNQPRAATIACKTDCHFAVMNKADYQKCLLTVTKRRIQAILDFLKDLPFLGPHLSRTQLVKLQYSLEKRTYRRGQYVVREGDPVSMVYIIRTGEFELQKRLILEAKPNKKEEHQIEEGI